KRRVDSCSTKAIRRSPFHSVSAVLLLFFDRDSQAPVTPASNELDDDAPFAKRAPSMDRHRETNLGVRLSRGPRLVPQLQREAPAFLFPPRGIPWIDGPQWQSFSRRGRTYPPPSS